jgi:hypothetical protein
VKRFPQHECGTFGGGQRLEQKEQRGFQGFLLFGFEFGANAAVETARRLRVEMRLVTRTRRLNGIDGEPRSRCGEKCGGCLHWTTIARLPAYPDLLDHVLGVGRIAHDAIGDAEQSRPRAHKQRGGLLEVNNCLLHAHVLHDSVAGGSLASDDPDIFLIQRRGWNALGRLYHRRLLLKSESQ